MPRMTGNHISIGGNGGQYFFIDWQLAGQDVTNNYSAINWQAYFHYNSADAQLDNGIAGLSGTRWNNGGRVKNFEGRFVTRDVILASGSFNIGHNADGTQGISVSGGVSAYQSGRSAGSQWFSLPTIPRNSQVTSTGSAVLGDPVQISTNRKSSSFTHTITIRMHNSGGTVLQTINSVGDSTTWTPSPAQITQMQNAIPNTNSLTLWIWSHNNQVGQGSETTTRLDITDANPVFNDFTYKDSSSVATITGDDQVLVKGKSTLEVTVSAGNRMTAQKGASEDYYSFAYDGASNNVSYSTSAITSSFTNVDSVGSRAILVTAYDSRTNNTRVAKNVEVYDYVEPNIEIEISREDNFGANVTIETGGDFDLLPINGVNKNSLTASSLKYRYKEKGGSWTSWTDIPFTVSGNGFTGSNQFITLDNTKEFEFEFQIADEFGTHTKTAELGRGTPIMFRGRRSDGSAAVGIGKIPEDGVLDVDGDIYSNGEKVAKITDISAVINYSTSEQDTGVKWVDGKNVYQKSYVISVVAGSGGSVSHGISGLTRVIKWENSFYRSDVGVTFSQLNLPSIESVSPMYAITVALSSTNVVIPGAGMPYNGTAYVTISYIK